MIPIILTLFVPILGIVAILINEFTYKFRIELVTLITMLMTLTLFFIGLVVGFSNFNIQIIRDISLSLSLGIYGINLPFIFISILIPLFTLWPAYHEITRNKFWFYFLLMIIYTSLIGSFESLNLLLFFIFWEIAIISVFILIYLFLNENVRFNISIRFLIFTQVASLLVLVAFTMIFYNSGTFMLTDLINMKLPYNTALIIVSLLTLAAMIKMPLFPLHVWLPDTYNFSPNSIVILLSGLFSKLGGFMLIVFGFNLFGYVFRSLHLLMWVGVISALYASFLALSQNRFKSIIIYSSIVYMSLAFTAIFADNIIAIYGAVFLMVSYSLISTMLFFLSDIINYKINDDNMNNTHGLLSKMPKFSIFFIIGILSSLGLPGFSNFIGELLVVIGLYLSSGYSLVILISLIVATFYYLTLIKNLIFGGFNGNKKILDVDGIEMLNFNCIYYFGNRYIPFFNN